MRLTHPIVDFGQTLADLSPKRRRTGRDIRSCGALGANEDAKRLRLIEDLCGLSRGAGRRLVAADVWGVWAEIEGFAGELQDVPSYPLTLGVPVKAPDGTEIVALAGPDRPILGEDMIAAGECGQNEDAKTLVYTERLCVGLDAAGRKVPLTAGMVDEMDGADLDRAWVGLLPFFSGIPGRPTSASGSPS